MKKIIGLAAIILIAGIGLRTLAQSRPGAVKSKGQTETAPSAEQAEDQQVATPKPVSKPGSSNQSTTVSKPEPVSKPGPSSQTTPVTKPVPVSKPVPNTGTSKPVPVIKPKTETGNTNSPSRDKRMHAEQRSNGHAFSGKGKGGDKNLVDPVVKDKKIKTKKNNKGKKAGNSK